MTHSGAACKLATICGTASKHMLGCCARLGGNPLVGILTLPVIFLLGVAALSLFATSSALRVLFCRRYYRAVKPAVDGLYFADLDGAPAGFLAWQDIAHVEHIYGGVTVVSRTGETIQAYCADLDLLKQALACHLGVGVQQSLRE